MRVAGDKTIWKFPIPITDGFKLNMPERARFLSAQLQGSAITAWFEVDPAAEEKTYAFAVVGTGNPVPRLYDFLATIQQAPFVWHLYEFCYNPKN